MAPLICWSLSSPMFRYLFLDHAVPATWRSLEAARFKADCPSGKAPTTRVRRLISRRRRSSGLLVRMRRQCSSEGVVGQGLFDPRFSKLGRLGEAKAAQLLDHSAVLAGARLQPTDLGALRHAPGPADRSALPH